MKRRRRRTLKRRLRRQLRKAEAAGDTKQVAVIVAALDDRDILNQTIDNLRTERALGDGAFLELLLNVDWEKLLALIIKLIGAFA